LETLLGNRWLIWTGLIPNFSHGIGWLSENPLAGDVIPGADGARKVRWASQGRGKRGGARLIYFNVLDDGYIVLIAAYTKSVRENLPTKAIRKAK